MKRKRGFIVDDRRQQVFCVYTLHFSLVISIVAVVVPCQLTKYPAFVTHYRSAQAYDNCSENKIYRTN